MVVILCKRFFIDIFITNPTFYSIIYLQWLIFQLTIFSNPYFLHQRCRLIFSMVVSASQNSYNRFNEAFTSFLDLRSEAGLRDSRLMRFL